MEENSSPTEKTYQEIFQAGIFSFERGDYQGAIAQFQQALSGVNEKTQIGGEIQIWLANAYDAVGNSTEAIALCRRLKNHSDRDVRKSANYVLGILSAPQLSDLKDAVSKIPSLKSLDESDLPSNAPSSKSVVKLKPEQEVLLANTNNSESQQQSSWFIWVTSAIILAALIVWATI